MDYILPTFENRQALLEADNLKSNYNLNNTKINHHYHHHNQQEQKHYTVNIKTTNNEYMDKAKFNGLHTTSTKSDTIPLNENNKHKSYSPILGRRHNKGYNSICLKENKDYINSIHTHDGRLKEDYIAMMKEVEIMRHEKGMLDQKIMMSQQTIHQLEIENDNLQTKYTRLKIKYRAKKDRLMKFKAELEEVTQNHKKDIIEMNNHYGNLEAKNIKLNEKFIANGKEVMRRNQKLSRLIDEDDSNMMMEAHEQEIKDYRDYIRDSNSMLKSEIQKLTDDKKKLYAEKIILLNNMTDIEDKNSKLIDKNNYLRNEINKLKSINENLLKDKETMQESLIYEKNYNKLLFESENAMKIKLENVINELNNANFKLKNMQSKQNNIYETSNSIAHVTSINTAATDNNNNMSIQIMQSYDSDAELIKALDNIRSKDDMELIKKKIKDILIDNENLRKELDDSIQDLDYYKTIKNEELAKLKQELIKKDEIILMKKQEYSEKIRDINQECHNLKNLFQRGKSQSDRELRKLSIENNNMIERSTYIPKMNNDMMISIDEDNNTQNKEFQHERIEDLEMKYEMMQVHVEKMNNNPNTLHNTSHNMSHNTSTTNHNHKVSKYMTLGNSTSGLSLTNINNNSINSDKNDKSHGDDKHNKFRYEHSKSFGDHIENNHSISSIVNFSPLNMNTYNPKNEPEGRKSYIDRLSQKYQEIKTL